MIKQLDLTNQQLAQSVLSIQFPAYQVEANLIGFQWIPALSDTEEDLMNSKEIFIGFYEDSQLFGVLSYEETEEIIDICRLVVSPDSFRKGVGRQLVEYVTNEVRQSRDVVVSTGQKNTPAVTLYKRLGFVEEETFEVADGVRLINLRYST
ncbi:GNAT family N-acetyltransferase [Paenisporosarcina indica]|uniref:GNAT family N-acetyltransferase n=1 Tax=Paenisporosarcina indica TaxID=650093 RepID=UPI000950093E|nr:GNAT family N-acetyltransferase [Paenisporosarcina indica]